VKRFSPILYLKGMAMGAADMVPGVSGGTMALVLGIYWELIFAIKSIGRTALRVYRKDGFAVAWRQINGDFIITLLAGMLTSILFLAKAINFLLIFYEMFLWSFFFGLVVGSFFILIKKNRPTRWYQWLLFCFGVSAALALSRAPLMVIEFGYLGLFFSGWLAFCAMIIPGISGTLILVLLGLYATIIEALDQMHLDILATFGIGGLIGLMAFSRLLARLRPHEATVVITMCGFLLGSLNAIWPWKQPVVAEVENGILKNSSNLWPHQYALVADADPQVVYCFIWALVGIFLVALISFSGSKLDQKRNLR
jgi:putative membrane protein